MHKKETVTNDGYHKYDDIFMRVLRILLQMPSFKLEIFISSYDYLK